MKHDITAELEQLRVGGPFDGLVVKFIDFLQTGVVPAGLFAEDVFLDFTPPLWRLQAKGVEGVKGLRHAGHPEPGLVPRWRTDWTEKGFLIEFEETWLQGGQQWYCREMARADVTDGVITDLSVYCTGDWDSERVARHGRAVRLLRP